MEMHVYRGWLLALLFLVCTIVSLCGGCVTSCQCTKIRSTKKQKGQKVDCTRHPAPIRTLTDVIFPLDTVHLNLAHNALTTLKQASFIHLSSLQKLNLSTNQISVLESGAFDGLQRLKKLDLSRNLIGSVNSSMFSGLPKLEKLYLSYNYLALIPDGTFSDLRSLKLLEFNSEYLRCDCHLKWILKWAKTRHVQIPRSTLCALPAEMKGRPLSKLKVKNLRCDHKVQLKVFDIHPSESQLVFQGDKLPFECHASITPGYMEIAWFRGGQIVTSNKTQGLFVHTSHNLDRTIINHKLVVESLDLSHAGEWYCVVTTAAGNLTKKVHVEVHTPEIVMKCPSVTKHTAKGIYNWNETEAGLVVSQPCQKGLNGAKTAHKCGLDGRWKKLDISSCSFLKNITCKLSKFAKMAPDSLDIPTVVCGLSKALVTASYSGEGLDSFDVFYMSKIMNLLFPYSAFDARVASLLVNLVSNASSLPRQELDFAQMETKSPFRMVKMLEEMIQEMNPQTQSLEWSEVSENVAVVVLGGHVLKTGFSCVLYGSRESLDQGFAGSNIICNSTVTVQNIQVYINIPALLIEKSEDESAYPYITALPETHDSVKENATKTHNLQQVDNFNSSSTSNDTLFPATVLLSASVSHQNEHINSSHAHLDTVLDIFLPDIPDESTNKSAAISSYSVAADQLEDLNISSHHFSTLSKPKNTSAKTFFSLPSSLDIYTDNPSLLHRRPIIPQTPGIPSYQTGVRVVIYRNGKLFPEVRSELSDGSFKQGNWAVSTPIVAVYTGGQAHNLSQPLTVMFTVLDTTRPLKAAYFDINSGYGRWRTDGCEIVHRNGSIITVHVRHVSYFALLHDLSYVYRLASFSVEPIVYIGSGICILCMASIIVTFTTCFRSIGIPKKIKHSVVNVCISTLMLMVVFMFGINRRDMEVLCQIVGIFIHYLTLCVIFWITVCTNITYKKFVKASQPAEPPPEPILMPLPPKPILQFYFVGYGVPIIICGITAAVNVNFYTGYHYCFLEWEPSVGAFYLPVMLLVAWNLMLFMRISCVVRSVTGPDNKAATESDNKAHGKDVESVPLQPDAVTTAAHNTTSGKANSKNGISGDGSRRRSRQASGSGDDDEDASVISIPDQERRPISQLRSLVAVLFMFIFMWVWGALAIARPFPFILPYQEVVFSYVYGLTSSSFGVFMIMYFCITREDSLLLWKRAGRCALPEMNVIPVSAPEPPAKLATSPQQPRTKAVEVKSCSNSDLSLSSQKSSSIVKNLKLQNIDDSKQLDMNLIKPNSSDTSFSSTQENFPNFYNARQKGAAKKFWEKHRHHGKIISKDTSKDLNSSLSDNSAGELNQRLSHGSSSGANTRHSVETESQPKEKQVSFSEEMPAHTSNFHSILSSSLEAVLIEHNSKVHRMLDTKDTRPVIASQSELDLVLAGQQRSPSSDETGIHFSAFTPVQPHCKNILPRLGKPDGEEGELTHKWQEEREELESKNHLSWSLSQIREVDGQSQGSESSQRPPNPGIAWSPLHCNLSHTPPPSSHSQQQLYPFDFSVYPSSASKHGFNVCQMQAPGMSLTQLFQQYGQIPPFNIPPSPYLVRSRHHHFMAPESSSSQSQSNHRRSSSGSWCPASESSDSSRQQKLIYSRESSEATGTSANDSQECGLIYQNSENRQKRTDRARSVDSDPMHRRRYYHSDRHKNKLSNRQRSVGWSEQFKDRPSKASYAYVNHTYQDRVIHRLIEQASENNDLAKKAFWLPRSASEYDRLTHRGFSSVAEDTSCSTDEEGSADDSSWIRQSLEFRKKETSV